MGMRLPRSTRNGPQPQPNGASGYLKWSSKTRRTTRRRGGSWTKGRDSYARLSSLVSLSAASTGSERSVPREADRGVRRLLKSWTGPSSRALPRHCRPACRWLTLLLMTKASSERPWRLLQGETVVGEVYVTDAERPCAHRIRGVATYRGTR